MGALRVDITINIFYLLKSFEFIRIKLIIICFVRSRSQLHSLGPAKNQMNHQGTSTSGNSNTSDERVTLIVDNTRFISDPALFTAHPNTMLGR